MPVGLYLHYPFCTNCCGYCNFFKLPFDREREKRYYRALIRETELVAAEWPDNDRRISSLFVGGGTPSLTDFDLFAAWLDRARELFEFMGDIEFSVECNPESADSDTLIAFKQLGVTRPTFGIQSFDSKLLKQIGRIHKPHDSQRAIYLANVFEFDSIGVDIMYGLPGQNVRMFEADLGQIIDLDPPHVSMYQLTVEPDTPLWSQVVDKKVIMPSPERTAELYSLGSSTLNDAGYHRYEILSFARPGHECRHNLGYWQGRDYLGLGPSAHSFIEGRRYANEADLSLYVESLECGRRPLVHDQSGMQERITEAIMLGLRLNGGINRRRFAAQFGQPLDKQLNRTQYNLLVESGHLIPDRGNLRLSEEGINLADEITRRLLK